MLYHQDVRFCTGDNKTLYVSISNPSNQSISGAVATYIMATAPMGRQLFQKVSPATINITTGVAPVAIILEIGLRNDDTALLDPGDYYHEAMLQLSGGLVTTVMSGKVRLDPSNITSTL